jgi:hypothetical protein
MDRLLQIAISDWTGFKETHLFAKPGVSPVTLRTDHSIWNWSQIWTPRSFVWKAGVTPFSDLGVLKTDVDTHLALCWILCYDLRTYRVYA